MTARYRALAADYDDTLAERGVVASATAAALAKLRRAGFQLILVTGRVLPELHEVAGDLSIFDRVVGENGAVLYRPETAEKAVLGPPPDIEFLDTLQQRGVHPLSVGDVIVATGRRHEATIREAILELKRGLQVICNDDSVMVLPTGIDKMSGLQVALDELALSAYEVVGVGNAENDHAFLDQCGFPVAVANAVTALKERARLVTNANRGEGVVELAEMLLETGGRLGTRTPDPFGVNEVL